MATHTVMPKKLAQALMESSMQHFDGGGTVQTGGGDISGFIGGGMQGIAKGLTAQNQFYANAPDITTQDFAPNIQEQYNRSSDVYGQQQNLANALQAQSQGQGPNPAQAALANETAKNAQMQGAMMASQRGAGANPALLARQAAMQGANTQQQAAGQSSVLQAQQQLAAQNALQNQQSNMASGALQGQNIQQGGLAAQNSALTTGQLGAQQINANTAQANTNSINKTSGGIMSGITSALGGGMFSKGGEVKKYAEGGGVSTNYAVPGSFGGVNYGSSGAGAINPPPQGKGGSPEAKPEVKPKSTSTDSTAQPWELGGGMAGGPGDTMSNAAPASPGVEDAFSSSPTMLASRGGMIKKYDEGGSVNADYATPGGGENVDYGSSGAGAVDPKQSGGGGGGGGIAGIMKAIPALAAMNKGGEAGFSKKLLKGGDVPGKAKVNGDDEKNDTVKTLLSPGEVVLPRSVTQSPDAAKKAEEFMKHLHGSKKPGYGKVIEARKSLKDRVEHLEKLMCGGKV